GGDSWKAMVFSLSLDGGGSGWGCLGAPDREGGVDDHQPLTFWRLFAASYAARATATSGRAEISGTATSHQAPPSAVEMAGSVSMTMTEVRGAVFASTSAASSAAMPSTRRASAPRLAAWAAKSTP